jgi:hypothetical protein
LRDKVYQVLNFILQFPIKIKIPLGQAQDEPVLAGEELGQLVHVVELVQFEQGKTHC